MQELIQYVNGEFVPTSEAKISVLDRALSVGDAVFDTERTFAGKVFRLREHLERLYKALHMVRIDPGMSIDELQSITVELARRNDRMRQPNGDYWVTQMISRGSGTSLLEPERATVVVKMTPIVFASYAKLYDTGAHVVFPTTRRDPPQALDARLKTISRMNLVMAEIEAKQIDPAAYAVLLDIDGNLSENTGGNFFVVTDGVIRTAPARNVLAGISRQTVLELARDLDIPTAEETLTPYDAYNADEAFLTTTSYCALPVGKINGNPLRADTPGPVTKQILAAWSERAGMDIVDQAMSHIT